MSIPRDDQRWDEFHDIEIIDWKRVRSSIEHENSLTNHRFTWLLNTQAFLLTAFVLVLQASTKSDVDPNQKDLYPLVLGVLAFAGILTAIFFQRPLMLAYTQHEELRKWWFKRVANKDMHPPISGYYSTVRDRFFPQHRLPFVFVIIWIILASSILAYLSELRKLVIPYFSIVGYIVLALVVILGFLYLGVRIGVRVASRQQQLMDLQPGDIVHNPGPTLHKWVDAEVIRLMPGGFVEVRTNHGEVITVHLTQVKR